MDNPEQHPTLTKELRTTFEFALDNSPCQWGHQDCDGDEEKQAARDWLSKCPPDNLQAIPTELRELIEGVGCRHPDCKNETCRKYTVARSWLASAPGATDKAVCPKCGCFAMLNANLSHAVCSMCGKAFKVVVSVISPPRTEKGVAK